MAVGGKRVTGSFAVKGSPTTTIAVAPDGRHVVSGGYGYDATLWEIATGKKVKTFVGGNDYFMHSLTFLPDGKHFLSGDVNLNIRMWDMQTGDEKSPGYLTQAPYGSDPDYNMSGVWDMSVSPCGQILALAYDVKCVGGFHL